ncbi:hypothetical protein Cpir12675_005555, partial [Ceratocystis pirilliformis]
TLRVSMETAVSLQYALELFHLNFEANLCFRKEYGIDPSGELGGAGVDTLVHPTPHSVRMIRRHLCTLLS